MGGDFDKSSDQKPTLRDLIYEAAKKARDGLSRQLNQVETVIMSAAVEAVGEGCKDLYFMLIHPSCFEVGEVSVDSAYLQTWFQHFAEVQGISVESKTAGVSLDDDYHKDEWYGDTYSDIPHSSPDIDSWDSNPIGNAIFTGSDDWDEESPCFEEGIIVLSVGGYEIQLGTLDASYEWEGEEDEDGEEHREWEIKYGDWNLGDSGTSRSTTMTELAGFRKMPARLFDTGGVSSRISRKKREFINNNSYEILLMRFDLS